ncbi:MAG: RES family NAD+ phosphorylase [Terracidiphilus sp.]|jgi:RES domain-containing protein
MIVFRMHGILHDTFDSAGPFLQPGRWHSAGTRVIYAAEHASLAVLETLIHAGGRKMPPKVIARIHLPEELLIESAPWMEMPASQLFGDAWAREARSAVLRVPSIAVNRMESNFVLNPGHPDFPRIHHDPPEEFVFDPRFFLAA